MSVDYGTLQGLSGVIDTPKGSGAFTITVINHWSMPLTMRTVNRPGFPAVHNTASTYAVGDIIVGSSAATAIQYRAIGTSYNTAPPNTAVWNADAVTYPQPQTMGVEMAGGVAVGQLETKDAINIASIATSSAQANAVFKTGYGRKYTAKVRVNAIHLHKTDRSDKPTVTFQWVLAGPLREELL